MAEIEGIFVRQIQSPKVHGEINNLYFRKFSSEFPSKKWKNKLNKNFNADVLCRIDLKFQSI
jgi:hypothetical protein